MSVTFLVLVCGVIWSAWFLDETITLFILGGASTILAGTSMALEPIAGQRRTRQQSGRHTIPLALRKI